MQLKNSDNDFFVIRQNSTLSILMYIVHSSTHIQILLLTCSGNVKSRTKHQLQGEAGQKPGDEPNQPDKQSKSRYSYV